MLYEAFKRRKNTTLLKRFVLWTTEFHQHMAKSHDNELLQSVSLLSCIASEKTTHFAQRNPKKFDLI